MNPFLALLLLSLACFRLTRLVTDDGVTQAVRSWIVRKAPRAVKAKAKEGIECPMCVSFYIALSLTGLANLLDVFPRPEEALLFMPATWGASVLWNQLFVKLSK